MKLLKLLISVFLVLSFSSSILAENNQTVVLGGGSGPHNFSGRDNTREGGRFTPGVYSGGGFRLFSEWYVLGNFGIGLLANYQTAFRDYSDYENDVSVTQTWTIRHYFGTINIIPFGGETYARMGLYVGGGPSEYSVKQEVWSATTDDDETFTVNGTATTYGIYGDWGGDFFGMRAGVQFIDSNYPDMEVDNQSYKISSSGATMHFDFRWAF